MPYTLDRLNASLHQSTGLPSAALLENKKGDEVEWFSERIIRTDDSEYRVPYFTYLEAANYTAD